MQKITIDTNLVPSFEALTTAHWSTDQQLQFAKAVSGIKGAEWFQCTFKEAGDLDRERIAIAFAFASFAELRKRIPGLAERDGLMQDAQGLRCPQAHAEAVALMAEAIPG